MAPVTLWCVMVLMYPRRPRRMAKYEQELLSTLVSRSLWTPPVSRSIHQATVAGWWLIASDPRRLHQQVGLRDTAGRLGE